MNHRLFLIGATLALLLAALPAEARPAPACVEYKNNACPGIVCVDENLDGYFQWDECIGMYCPMTPGPGGCCGGPCPPPMEASVDTSATCTGYTNLGGTKQRTCVDADRAPECGAWNEGWHPILGYYKTCYGTGGLALLA